MFNCNRSTARRGAALVQVLLLSACASPSGGASEVQSPAVVISRRPETTYGENGVSYTTDTDDRSIVAKVTAPVTAVWNALVTTMAANQINPTIIDRSTGRIGDTSWVLMRRLNGEQLSTYLSCGSNMTGQRANEERVHAVILAQMTRLPAETTAVSLHFSAYTQPVASGSSNSAGQCTSTGRLEKQLLDEVIRRSRSGNSP